MARPKIALKCSRNRCRWRRWRPRWLCGKRRFPSPSSVVPRTRYFTTLSHGIQRTINEPSVGMQAKKQLKNTGQGTETTYLLYVRYERPTFGRVQNIDEAPRVFLRLLLVNKKHFPLSSHTLVSQSVVLLRLFVCFPFFFASRIFFNNLGTRVVKLLYLPLFTGKWMRLSLLVMLFLFQIFW